MKTGLNIAFAIIALTAMTGTSVAEAKRKAPHFSCPRHIYNTSTSPWTFQANTFAGNVYFENTGCPQNGPCTLQPGTTTAIQYTTTGGISGGTMTVTDNQGTSVPFNYSSTASPIPECPYIAHNGNTGAVAVNDPANGDWNAWGQNWSSSAHKTWPKRRAPARKH